MGNCRRATLYFGHCLCHSLLITLVLTLSGLAPYFCHGSFNENGNLPLA